ncbi:MAG: class I SAM-dependent methyltransferase [Treponema sp.]|nr:class I SAM-dependent methyltransferase [Treponema sp.]
MTILEKYYNKFKEDHRLTTRHGMVEFTVSMKYIHDYIENIRSGRENSRIKILDIGAGTGRYSLALAREDFDVTAVELVKHNLEILQSKHEKVKSWQGDARSLSFLPDETFDLTLLFGPLYHLHSDQDRLAALSEAKRVTKKGGFILVAYVMNEYAVLSYCFREGKISEVLKKGTLTKDFHTITNIEEDLYSYTRLEDMDRLNEKAGLKRVKIFAPDGAADYMRREINALDEESFAHFIEYQMAVCERPDLLGASSHTVDVLRK